MLQEKKSWLLAVMMLFQITLQAQESAYYVDGNKDHLHKVSLSNKTTEDIGSIPFTGIDSPGVAVRVSDLITSGDSIIYILGKRYQYQSMHTWEIVKYDISNNSFSSLGELPDQQIDIVFFDSVLDGEKIILEIGTGEVPSTVFNYHLLNLADMSLEDLELNSPRVPFPTGNGYFRDPIDKTLWFLKGEGVYEKELFQLDESSGEINGPFISMASRSVLAFDGLGGVLATKFFGGFLFIGRLDVNSGVFEKLTVDGVQSIVKVGVPLPEKKEGAFLKVSAPQVRLKGIGDEFRPLHWSLIATNRGDREFTIDSVRWGQAVFDIEGEQDNLILQVGESRSLELAYTAVDLAVRKDTLKIYANSEGLYKIIPIRGEFILTSDGTDLTPLAVDGLLVKENSTLVERGENFEKLEDEIATCEICRHAISPEGVLFRLTDNAALEAYDPGKGYFLQVRDLSDRINIPVDLTFQNDGTMLILDRKRVRDIYGVYYNLWTASHYDYPSDMITASRKFEDTPEGSEFDIRAKAIEYNEEINKPVILLSKFGTPDLRKPTEIRSYDSTFLRANVSTETFAGVTIEDIYQGKAGAWFGIEAGNIFYLDRQTQQAVKVAHIDGASEIVGYKTVQTDTINFSHKTVDFDKVLVADDTIRHVFIANGTEETIRIEEITFSDNSFSTAQELPLEISPGVRAVKLIFRYRPGSQGLLRDTARITLSNGQQANWQVDIGLEGEGINADETIKFTSREVDLGTTFVSSTSIAGISAVNISKRIVQIEDITFDNPFFTYPGELPLSILPGQLAQTVDFMFSPDSSGTETSIATMTLNNGRSSWQVQTEMRGEGDFGTVLSDTAINFGQVVVAEDSVISIIMRNLDFSVHIELGEITFDNLAFSHKMELPYNVYAAHGDRPIKFAFVPVAEGEENGTATLKLNKPPNSWLVRIELRGEGTPLQIVTSIESEDALNGLQVFPNPLKSKSKLSFSGVSPKVEELKFFNLRGQLQYSYLTESRTQFDIDLGNLSSEGVLLIRFLSKEGKYLGSRPLLIQR